MPLRRFARRLRRSFFGPVTNKGFWIEASASIGQDVKQATQAIRRPPCGVGRNPPVRVRFKHDRSFDPLTRSWGGWPLKHHTRKRAPHTAPILVSPDHCDAQLENCQRSTKNAGLCSHACAALEPHQKRAVRSDFQHFRIARVMNSFAKSGATALEHGISLENHFAIRIHDENEVLIAVQGDVFYREKAVFAADIEG